MRFPSTLILDSSQTANPNLVVEASVARILGNTSTVCPRLIGKFSNLSALTKKFTYGPSRLGMRQTQPQFGNFWTIVFLRKEYLYSKLKYSRTPSYDIVSGGVALLFAGFLGFLTTEKFGFELVDSGDFYFMGMYVLLLIFPLRLLLKSLFDGNRTFVGLGIKEFWLFIRTLFTLRY